MRTIFCAGTCSFTFVVEFVTDRTCRSLALAFDCQHWTTVQQIIGLRKNAIKSKRPGLSLASGPAGIGNMFFCCPIYMPIEKAYSTKQRYYCNSLSCKLLPQLIETSATKRFFFFDRQVSYSCLSHSSSVLAVNDCRVVLTFLQRSPSFSLASASRVQHDNESWHGMPTNVRTSQTPTTWTRTTAELVRGRMCSRKKKPYHNVARQSSLIFSIFLHQISGEFSRFLRQPQQSPRLAPQCLAFP